MKGRQNRRWTTMDKSDLDLSTLIKHLEIHNRTEGKSPRTVEWYNEVLGLLYRWLQEEGLPTNLGSIDEMVIRQFILDLQSRPGCKSKTMSSHSIYNRVNALRAFFNWLYQRGYTEEHVLLDLKQPKKSEIIIEPLSPAEIQQVFAAVDPNTALGARNTAMISLFLDSGLRLSELAGLQEDDLHLEEQYLKVMGKGQKERLVSYGSACQKALMHYTHYFRVQPCHQEEGAFFLTMDGYPMTPSAIKSLIKRLAKTCGVPRLHPHLFRHSFATMYLLQGGDIFNLQSLLGHTSLEMVQNYLHWTTRTTLMRGQQFSPLDRLNVDDNRRYRHRFAGGNGAAGHIYPNTRSTPTNKKRSRSSVKRSA